MHGDIANDAGEGRTDLVIGELLFLRVRQGGGRGEVGLGVLKRLDGLVVGLAGDDAGLE